MAAPKQLVWLELGQKLLKKSGAALSIHTNLALHLWPKHWGMQPSWGPEKHRYKIRNTQTYFDNSIFFRLSSLERNKRLNGGWRELRSKMLLQNAQVWFSERTRELIPIWNSSSWGSSVLFWFLWALQTHSVQIFKQKKTTSWWQL